MRSFNLASTTAALAVTATASNVTLAPKPCSTSTSTAANLLTLPLNTASPLPQDLSQTCGLTLISASAAIDPHTITCHIYLDAAATSPLSAILSLNQPITFAEHEIKTGSLLCKTTPLVDANAVGILPRAEPRNATATHAHLMVASGSPPVVTTAQGSLQTAGASASAGVSGSAGRGSHHGRNGTSLSGTATPTQTSSEAQASETGGDNAAVRVGAGWGLGFLAAGVVAVVL